MIRVCDEAGNARTKLASSKSGEFCSHHVAIAVLSPPGHRICVLDTRSSEIKIADYRAKMNIPEYVTQEEVRRVCSAIGIRDWTALTEAKVEVEEANVIKTHVGGEALSISTEDFRDGLEIELEHGLAFSDANVTNNHPILTGRIVLAHLKETLDYYIRLRVVEIEGDMLKAFVARDPAKLMLKYRLWVAAKAELAERERAIAARTP